MEEASASSAAPPAAPGLEAAHSGPPPAPSPLSGGYLLIILGEPHCEEHKDIILQRLAKGFLSWDADVCHVDLEKELLHLAAQKPDGEESKNGERLIQFASESLVTEVLIQPQTTTLIQCARNLLSSFTRHRHIIHAGYTFAGNGSWALQDGTFSLMDFLDALKEPEPQRVIRAYENSVSIDIQCSAEGEWSTSKIIKEPGSKGCAIRVNPDDKMTAGSPGITQFVDYISGFLSPAGIEELLEPSDVVGNIRFSHPTLYVFPGGQGDAALFGINGFNMLVDGGYSRKSCFWDFTRHLDRLDAVMVTRLSNSNVGGISSVLKRKTLGYVYPQIGHFFCNMQERKSLPSPDGDKDRDPLLIDLLDEGHSLIANLQTLELKPHACYREAVIEPINLYHKVGHGKLDMYVLSPAKDSKEVKEFLAKWIANDQKLFSSKTSKLDSQFPIYNQTSICALLVWQPANPTDTITRILFPGSTPQHKIFEGLEKIKHLEFLKYPTCTAKTMAAAIPKPKSKMIEKPILESKSVKKSLASIPVEQKIKAMEAEKNIKNNQSNVKTEKKIASKSEDKRESPPTPKKAADSKPKVERTLRRTRSPTSAPAKSDKEANNRKVLESKEEKVKASSLKSAPKRDVVKEPRVVAEKRAPIKKPRPTATAPAKPSPPVSPKKQLKPKSSPKKVMKKDTKTTNAVKKVIKNKEAVAPLESKAEIPVKSEDINVVAETVKIEAVDDVLTATIVKESESVDDQNMEAMESEVPESQAEDVTEDDVLSDKQTEADEKVSEVDVDADTQQDDDVVTDDGENKHVRDEEESEKERAKKDAETMESQAAGNDEETKSDQEAKLESPEEAEEIEEDEKVGSRKTSVADVQVSDESPKQEGADATEDQPETEALDVGDQKDIDDLCEKENDEASERNTAIANVEEDKQGNDGVEPIEEDDIKVNGHTHNEDLGEGAVQDCEVVDIVEAKINKNEDEISEATKEKLEGEVKEIISSAQNKIAVDENTNIEAAEAEDNNDNVADEEKLEISSEKQREESPQEEKKEVKLEEATNTKSHPDEKISAMETSATTAPSMPEDEKVDDKIILDEIEEEKQIEEKLEVDAAVQEVPLQFKEPLRAIQLEQAQMQHHRDLVKTPDEVADLPMHEEVDAVMFESVEDKKTTDEKPGDANQQKSDKKNEEVAKKDQQVDEKTHEEKSDHKDEVIEEPTEGVDGNEKQAEPIEAHQNECTATMGEKELQKSAIDEKEVDTSLEEKKSDNDKEEKSSHSIKEGNQDVKEEVDAVPVGKHHEVEEAKFEEKDDEKKDEEKSTSSVEKVELHHSSDEKDQTKSPIPADETDAFSKEKCSNALLDFEKVIDEEYGINASDQLAALEGTDVKEDDVSSPGKIKESEELEDGKEATLLDDQKDVFISDIDEKGSDAVGRRLSQTSDKIAASPEKVLAESSGIQGDTKTSVPSSPAPSLGKEGDVQGNSRTSTPKISASPANENAGLTEISKSPAPETNELEAKSRSTSPKRTESPLKELEDSLQEETPLKSSPLDTSKKMDEPVTQRADGPSPIPSPGLSGTNDTFAVDSILSKSPSPEPELKEIEALKGESPSPAPSISEAIAVQSGISLSPIPPPNETSSAPPKADVELERSDSQDKTTDVTAGYVAKPDSSSPKLSLTEGSPAPLSASGENIAQSPAAQSHDEKEGSKPPSPLSTSKVQEIPSSPTSAKSDAGSAKHSPTPLAEVKIAGTPVQSPVQSPGSTAQQSEKLEASLVENVETASPSPKMEKMETVSPVPSPIKVETISPSDKASDNVETVSPAPSDKVETVSPVPSDKVETVSPAPSPVKVETVSPVPSAKVETVSPAPSPVKVDTVSPAPSDKVETVSPAPSPVKMETVSRTPSEKVEIVSPAPSDKVEIVSPAPSDKLETVSPVPSDKVETVSPAPSAAKVETVSPVPSDKVETVSPAPSPVKVETVSPAPSDKVETVSPAASPVKVETVSPAPSDKVETVSPAPSAAKVETVSPVPSDKVETVSPAPSPVKVETVSPAPSDKVETVSPAPSAAKVETVSPVPSDKVETVSPAPSDEVETVSPAPSPVKMETVSPAPSDKVEIVSPAPSDKIETVSPAPSPVKVETVSPVPSDKVETVSPAPSPVKVDTASPAPSDKVATVSPAPSPVMMETVSPAPSDKVEIVSPAPSDKVETVSPAPSDKVETVSPVPSDKVETVSPAPSPVKVETVSPAPSDKVETVSPAPSDKIETVSPAPSLETLETVSPAPTMVKMEAVSPVPSSKKVEAISPAPSLEKVQTISPAPSIETLETVSPAPTSEKTISPNPTTGKRETVSPVPSEKLGTGPAEKAEDGSPVPSLLASKTGSPSLSPVPPSEKNETVSPAPPVEDNYQDGSPVPLQERSDSVSPVISKEKAISPLLTEVDVEPCNNGEPSPSSTAVERDADGELKDTKSVSPIKQMPKLEHSEIDACVGDNIEKEEPFDSSSISANKDAESNVSVNRSSAVPSPGLIGDVSIEDSKDNVSVVAIVATTSPTPSQSSTHEKSSLEFHDKENSVTMSPTPAELKSNEGKMELPSHPSVLEEIATTLGLQKSELKSTCPSPLHEAELREESDQKHIVSSNPSETLPHDSEKADKSKTPSTATSPDLQGSVENEEKRNQSTPSPALSQVSVHEESSLKDDKVMPTSPSPTPSTVDTKRDHDTPSPALSQGSLHDKKLLNGENKTSPKSQSPTHSPVLDEKLSTQTENCELVTKNNAISVSEENKDKSKYSSSALYEGSLTNVDDTHKVISSPTPSQTSVTSENLLNTGKGDVSKSPSPTPALLEDLTAPKDSRDRGTPSPALSQGSVHDDSLSKKELSKTPSPAPSPLVPAGTSETSEKIEKDGAKPIELTTSPERKSDIKESATESVGKSRSPTPSQAEANLEVQQGRSPSMSSPAHSDATSLMDGDTIETKAVSPAPSLTEKLHGGEENKSIKTSSPTPSNVSESLDTKVSKPTSPVPSPTTAAEDIHSQSPSPIAQLIELIPMKGDQSPLPSTSPLPSVTESDKQEDKAISKSPTPSASPIPDKLPSSTVNAETHEASAVQLQKSMTEAVDEFASASEIKLSSKSSSPVQTANDTHISNSFSPEPKSELAKPETLISSELLLKENIEVGSVIETPEIVKEEAARPQSALSGNSQEEATGKTTPEQQTSVIDNIADIGDSKSSNMNNVSPISSEVAPKTPSPQPPSSNVHGTTSPSPTVEKHGEQTADGSQSKSPSPSPSVVAENNLSKSQSPILMDASSRRASSDDKQENLLKSDIMTKVTSDLQLKEGLVCDSSIAEISSEVKTDISPASSITSGFDRKSPEKLFTSVDPAPNQTSEKTPSPSEVSDPITASYIEIINKLQSDSSDVASHTKIAQIDDPMTRSTLFGDSIETSVVPDKESIVQTKSVMQDASNIVDEQITKTSHHRLMLTASSEDGGEETEFDTAPQLAKELDDKIVIEAKTHEKMTVTKYQCEGGDDGTLPSSCTEKKVTSTGVTADKFSLPDDAKIVSRIEEQIELDHSSIFVAANSAVATKMGELDDVISSTQLYHTGKTDQLDRATTPEYDSVPPSPHSDISSGQMSRDPHVWDDNRSSSRQSELSEKDIASPPFTTSKLKFEVSPHSVMTGSIYGGLPGDEDVHPVVEAVAKDVKDSKNQIAKMGEIAAATIGAMAASLPFGGPSTSTNAAKEDDKSATAAVAPTKEKDPIESWGKPLGLPSPAPPATNETISQNGTPKKERRVVATKKGSDRQKSKSNKDSAVKNKIPSSPMYFDLTYVPHHGNSNYSQVEFFKNVRARYYVFSGIEPSREVYDALLEGKQSWDEKDLEVTIIPTYDTDTLGQWVAENEESIALNKIDLSPSASRCTINLQDHETSCSAYRLEF